MKKKIKYLLTFVAFIGIIIFTSMAYFAWKNQPPGMYGTVSKNIEYKKGQTLDIYLPTHQLYEKSPVLVFFHGGAWLGGYKESVNNARFNEAYNQLRDKGYTIISPSYTLGKFGKSPFPNAVEDAIDALNWIKKHADTYQLDTENVGILGESAGGQLALLATYGDANKYNKTLELTPSYFIAVYSPTDLDLLYKVQKPRLDSIKSFASFLPTTWQQKADINHYLFGFDPEEEKDKYQQFIKKYSPIDNIAKAEIPLMVIHGDADSVVPINQSENWVQKLNNAGCKVKYHVLNGVNHGLRGISTNVHRDVQKWIVDFAENHDDAS